MQIEPYLFFAGNCEEALAFYAKALDGKTVEMHRYAESPPGDMQVPAEWNDKVMHATFEAQGARFMASDAMPGQPAPTHGGISMSINIPKDAAKGEGIFNALAAGGKITMPFGKTFWGAQFGMVTDRFGVPWMINCDT